MKSDRISVMNENDMMNNFEFLDHYECLLEMQIMCLLFLDFVTRLWKDESESH